jgi:hypothetical protein
VLKYQQSGDLPDVFGKVRMAADMEEKIEATRSRNYDILPEPDLELERQA